MQTQTMDQPVDNWGQQLKSKDTSPNPSMFEMPALSQSSATDAQSEMMRLSQLTLMPFKIWMSAAEAWQRGWTDAVQGSTEPQAPPYKKAA